MPRRISTRSPGTKRRLGSLQIPFPSKAILVERRRSQSGNGDRVVKNPRSIFANLLQVVKYLQNALSLSSAGRAGVGGRHLSCFVTPLSHPSGVPAGDESDDASRPTDEDPGAGGTSRKHSRVRRGG